MTSVVNQKHQTKYKIGDNVTWLVNVRFYGRVEQIIDRPEHAGDLVVRVTNLYGDTDRTVVLDPDSVEKTEDHEANAADKYYSQKYGF